MRTSAAVTPADCAQFAPTGDPSDAAWLTVTLQESVDQVVDRWRHDVGTLPAALGVVSVDEPTRKTAATRGLHESVTLTDGITARTVRNPADLTKLGFTISRCLAELEDDGHEEIVVRLDSLTPLLMYRDVKPVFRFLHMLASRIQEAGARGHVHLDPAVHGERVAATLASAVDRVSAYPAGDGDPRADRWPGEWEAAGTATDPADRPKSE